MRHQPLCFGAVVGAGACFVTRLRWRSCAASGTSVSPVTIREARTSDARALAGLVMEAFRDSGAKTDLSGPLRALLSYVERGDLAGQFNYRIKRNKRRHALLLAEAGGEVVGCVEVGVLRSPQGVAEGDVARAWRAGFEERMPLTPYVGNLSVAKVRRRQGLGTRLVVACEEVARGWGAESIALHVDARNLAAQELYRRRGYACRAREPEWYPRVGRLQRLFLDKKLTGEEDGGAGAGGAKVATTVAKYDVAPVVHTRPLSMLEYLRWCIYDLQKRKTLN